MRDCATLNQLLVLANLESYNTNFIKQGEAATGEIQLLNQLAARPFKAIE